MRRSTELSLPLQSVFPAATNPLSKSSHWHKTLSIGMKNGAHSTMTLKGMLSLIMLIVTVKLIMLSVVKQSVVLLSVTLEPIMLSVVSQSVVVSSHRNLYIFE